MKIVFDVRNMGHVPSFKNSKRAILDRNTGKMRTLTEPEVKKWMESATDAFVSQLSSLTQTTDAVIPTEPFPHSLIVSSLPLDDSRQWIGEIRVKCMDAAKGDEGATIIIEPL